MYAAGTAETRAPGWALGAWLTATLLAQRGGLIHWVPVCLAVGIGCWFSLGWEPDVGQYALLAVIALVAIWGARRVGEAAQPLLIAVALVCVGAGIAGARAHLVAAPVLEYRHYGPVEGRIIEIDRSAAGALRLTLDRVRLTGTAPHATPERVRLSLYGDQGGYMPVPGDVVMATAHLSPPGGPVEPGGFDFSRKAWFERLGAVGYTRAPVLLAEAHPGGVSLAVVRVRVALSSEVQAALPGPRGAFAAAILTGDRAAIPKDALQDLRDANLAHLLAISGLHMGLLTGVVFAAVRALLALVPMVALRWPCKKIAAFGALAAGAAYLALSGGSVATVRAFIMVATVLAAVLVDRRAISLRNVAIAASLVLALTPEALSGPGFQMSFAATVALVAAFAAVRSVWSRMPGGWVGALLAGAGTTFFSSAVAGAATAPYAAAHFNRFTDYGLLANLAAVPLMGAVVMPAAVAAAVLAPLGLAGPALWVMGTGIAWILLVADQVAALDGAITPVVSPGPVVVPLLSLGLLVVLLWRGALRWAGLGAAAVALVLWSQAERPALLVSASGGLIGVSGAEGRALSKPRGDGFTARVWLENDGDAEGQEGAFERPGLYGPAGDRVAHVGDTPVRHVTGRGAASRASAPCGPGLVIVSVALDRRPLGPCDVYDAKRLRRTGALAGFVRDGDLHLVTATSQQGTRLWSAR